LSGTNSRASSWEPGQHGADIFSTYSTLQSEYCGIEPF
jgi:hypothetical protein